MTKATNSLRYAVLCGLASFLAPSLVAAQAVSVQPAAQTVALNAVDATTTFQFTAGGNVNSMLATFTITDVGADLTGETFEVFNGTAFVPCDGNPVAMSTPAGVTVTCNVATPNAVARYLVDAGAALPTVTTFGRVRYNVAAAPADANPDPSIGVGAICAVGISGLTGCTRFDDVNGQILTGTATGNTIDVVAGPSGPALIYNPAANTAIAVAASISGTAVTSTIAVTQTGGDTGESTTLACTAPTGYVATVTGSPFAPGGAGGSVGLACTGGAAAGNLSCTETRSGTGGGTPVVSTWPLTCAAAAGFASTPAPGGTVNLVGVTGSTASGAVGITNPGTAPLNITGAVVGGAGFTLGAVSSPIASGAAGSVGVSCAVPAQAGTTITGTLTFNTNATPATANYILSCSAQSASIPTLGNAGKALMVLLMLGFGLVGFQLYRRSA